MNILITGASGFIGKNLRQWLLQNRPEDNLICYDVNEAGKLVEYCCLADFVFHLAGVNRPDNDAEFDRGNKELTEEVLSYCREGKKPPVLLTSSVQAEEDNPYGKSKKAAERAVAAYGQDTGAPVYIYRLRGIFGKWCRPNYNSVVATFCHNIANGMSIEIRDPDFELKLLYIDDVCRCFLGAIDGRVDMESGYCVAGPVNRITLGNLASVINSFRDGRESLRTPDMSNALVRKLHSTYLSYLPDFSYPLLTRADERGSFTEMFKSSNSGQISVSITKPGYTKGNHWHHTKTEKFLTVSGQGVIRFRKIGGAEVIEYPVSMDKLEIVDIPPGFTHSLTNTGQTDMVTIIWVDEIFDPNVPDTFFEDVFPKGS